MGASGEDELAAASGAVPRLVRLGMQGAALIDGHGRAVVAALAVLAVLLVAVGMRHGIGVSSDSVGYTSAARSFTVDRSFTYFDGHPLVLWPVGYPLVLGLGMSLGLPVTAVGFGIDLVAVATLVALAAAIARRATGSAVLGAGVAAAIVIAQTTVHAYTQLWSEPLFLVACLAAVLLSMEIAERGPSPRRLAALVACIWAASNLRFMGVTLVPVVGVALLAASWRRPSLRTLVAAALATGIAGLGTLFVLVRNQVVGGTATGNWNPSHASIPALIQTTLVTVGHWLLPTAIPGLPFGLAIAALAGYGAVVLLRDPDKRRLAAPLGAYVLLYVGGLIAIESRVDGYIDERYLGPVLVPSLVLVAVALRDAWGRALAAGVAARSRGAVGRQRVAAAVAGAIVLGALAYAGANGVLSARYALLARPGLEGYNSAASRTSRLAMAAATAVGEPGAISNDPEHVYWVTGRFPTYAPRSFTRYGADAKAALLGWVRSGSVTVFIEFAKVQTSGGWQARDLRSWGIVLSDPVVYPDGTLYHLSLPATGHRSGMVAPA